MSSGTEKKVRFNPSAKEKEPEANRSLLRILWYAISALAFFILVIMALISGSYALVFLNQNPTCGANSGTRGKVVSTSIGVISTASVCLILVIGFAALQIRHRRRARRADRDNEDEEDDFDQDVFAPEEEEKSSRRRSEGTSTSGRRFSRFEQEPQAAPSQNRSESIAEPINTSEIQEEISKIVLPPVAL